MECLIDYIREDFKISRNTDLFSNYNEIKPHKHTGICLCISIYRVNHEYENIECDIVKYTCHKNDSVKFNYPDGEEMIATLDKGYYKFKQYNDSWWYVLLFEQDAITFLKTLSKNRKNEIDISVIFPEVDLPLFVHSSSSYDSSEPVITKTEINNMMKRIQKQL